MNRNVIDFKLGIIDTINYFINKNANIQIQITNSEGYIVKNIYTGKINRGNNIFCWDGRDEDNMTVMDGDYYLYLNAQVKNEHAVYDPFESSWGDIVDAENIIADMNALKIYYFLYQPSLVRIRTGISKEGLLYRTIINWEPRPAGSIIEEWNGFDNSELKDLSNLGNLEFSLNAYALPSNAIFVKNSNTINNKEYHIKRTLPPPPLNSNLHARHNRTKCHDPDISLSMPRAKLNKDNLPVVQDSTQLIVALSTTDQEFMENERFEYLFFIDDKYIFSEEYAYTPYRYNLKTLQLSDGNHILVVLAASSGDHVGSASIRFNVNNGRKKCCTKKS